MRTFALILAVAAAALPTASARSQDKANPPRKEQIEESAKKIKRLQKERIDTLKEMVDASTKLAIAARAPLEEALEARMLLLQAELDVAEKGAERVALYTGCIDTLKELEKIAETRVQSGRGNAATPLKIKARRLEVEIRLEQAKIKDANESK